MKTNLIQSFAKDELRLIIQKTRNQNQRQLFLVRTSFNMLPDIITLGKELNLISEVLLLKQHEDNIEMHKITDNTLPNACNPVVVLKKTTTAVLQTYNLPVPDPENRVSNLFDDIEDLFSVVCFQSDIVIDTTLEASIAMKISCKELIVIGSEEDLKIFKENLTR